MKLTRQELQLPSAQGIRLVALSYLDDASGAAERLTANRGEEDLHDFRVAVRRLRSWLRAFRGELADVKRSDIRRLKAAGAATNPARDLEVHLVWLAKAGAGTSARRQRGAAWLAGELQKGTGLTDEALQKVLAGVFEPARASLARALETYRQPVRSGSVETGSLAAAIGLRLVPHCEDLVSMLSQVGSAADEIAAHQARIRAKRLRYLLEPAASQVSGGTTIVRRLKALQDSLGTLHDLQLLAHLIQRILQESAASEARRQTAAILGAVTGSGEARAPDGGRLDDTFISANGSVTPADLLALARLLRSDVQRAFSPVQKKWLDGRHQDFSDRIQTMAARLVESR